jgi:hypothetical protein
MLCNQLSTPKHQLPGQFGDTCGGGDGAAKPAGGCKTCGRLHGVAQYSFDGAVGSGALAENAGVGRAAQPGLRTYMLFSRERWNEHYNRFL